MRVSRWGNSLAIRLPAALVERLGLREGDEVELRARDGVALEVERTRSRAALVEQLHKYHGMIGSDIKFDRDDANAR